MPLYGRNVQAVTANSSTTAESTTGAPIGTYARVKGAKGTATTPVASPNTHFGNTSAGSRASIDSTMYANDTPHVFTNGQAVGVFGVTATQMSNNITNNAKDRPAHAGWVLRKAGTGPVIGGAITAVGNNFANGETIVVSNGQTNATFTITSNATGNLVAITLTGGGSGFTNTSIAAIAFTREIHVANVQTTGSGLQYDNSSIVTVSNVAGVKTAGVFSLTTNATGGLTNTSFTALNVGLFIPTQTNAGLTFAVTNSTGGTATGNNSTTGLNARLIPSQGGTITVTLGGRAGRTQTETLIAAGSLGAQSAAYGTAATSNGLNAGVVSQLYYPGL
jgi:hypothetical protein